MSVDNSYLVIDLKKRKSNIFSCCFVMRKMRSLVSFETETKRGKYVIPAAPSSATQIMLLNIYT